jgi:hypothetical protein
MYIYECLHACSPCMKGMNIPVFDCLKMGPLRDLAFFSSASRAGRFFPAPLYRPPQPPLPPPPTAPIHTYKAEKRFYLL